MKLFLGNSIRLPLQPALQVIEEIPADLRVPPPRRDRRTHGAHRRKAPAKS